MSVHKKRFVLCLIVPLAVGGCAAWLSGGMQSFESLQKPPLSPPGWIFPLAWTVLYLMMGWASYLALVRIESRCSALGLYAVQLAMNFLWPILFFGFSNYWIAFVWLILLWLMILATAAYFYRISKPAGALMLPYLVWVAFAGYLNLGVAMLN